MAGTAEGARKAAATIKKKYGKNYYSNIALKSKDAWIENGRKPKGFSTMTPEKVSEAGRRGGTVSRKQSKTE